MKLKKYVKLIENFAALSVFKVVDLVIPLIVLPYLIHTVGADKYGVYGLAYVLVFYFLNVTQYGFLLSAVRKIAIKRDDKTELNRIFNEVFTTKLFLTIIAIAVLTLIVLLIPKFRMHYLVYLFMGLMMVGDLFFPLWFFLGIEKMRFITLINLISKSSFAVFVFILIKQPEDFVYISLYQAIGYLIAGMVAMILVVRTFKIKIRLVSFTSVKYWLNHSFSSFLTMITPTLYANTSIFLVGIFGLPQYVSFMEVGSKVSGAFSVVNTILTEVFYPHVNRNRNGLRKIKHFFVFMGFVFSILMYFSSEFLIRIWLGDHIDEIVLIVKIMSPSPFLMSIVSAYGVNGLMVHNKDRLYTIITATASVIGFVVGLIIIPKYFYVGGAIAIVSARIVNATLAYIYDSKVMKEMATTPNPTTDP